MRTAFIALIAVMAIGITGCELSKPYITKVDRQDQVVDSGNRGYLRGTPPPARDRGELKRPFMTVDIDLPLIEGKKTEDTRVIKPDENMAAPIRQETGMREEQVK